MERMVNLHRRRFLKSVTVSAVIGTTALLNIPQKAWAGKGELATLIDLTRCDGCRSQEAPACVSACKKVKKGSIPEPVDPIPVPFPTRKVEDWTKKKEISDRLTPYNLIFVQKAEVDVAGRKQTVFIPRRCMHCDNPACATLCPFASNHKHPNGAVVIDPDTCFGGAKCKTVCPWEIPQRQSGIGIYLKVLPTLMGNGIMVKCDLCNDLLKQGERPACIGACPKQAMAIGPREEIFARAEELKKKIGGYLYGKTENGGTSTLYVSAVPFDILNASIKKDSGRPGLGAVIRKMERTDGLGKVVLAAPAIGIAAGVFAFFFKRKNGANREG
jgi:formate dehydrogenase iron-sulfur subunit